MYRTDHHEQTHCARAEHAQRPITRSGDIAEIMDFQCLLRKSCMHKARHTLALALVHAHTRTIAASVGYTIISAEATPDQHSRRRRRAVDPLFVVIYDNVGTRRDGRLFVGGGVGGVGAGFGDGKMVGRRNGMGHMIKSGVRPQARACCVHYAL